MTFSSKLQTVLEAFNLSGPDWGGFLRWLDDIDEIEISMDLQRYDSYESFVANKPSLEYLNYVENLWNRYHAASNQAL